MGNLVSCPQHSSAYGYKKSPLAIKPRLHCFSALTFMKGSSHAKYPQVSFERQRGSHRLQSKSTPLDLPHICRLLGILFLIWFHPENSTNPRVLFSEFSQPVCHCSGAAEFCTEVGRMLPLSWLVPELRKEPSAMWFSLFTPLSQGLFFWVNLFDSAGGRSIGWGVGIKFPRVAYTSGHSKFLTLI